MYGVNKIFKARNNIAMKQETNINYNPQINYELTEEELKEYQYTKCVNDLLELDDFCAYSSDVEIIIKSLEEIGDYKDSLILLKEAKYQFAKRAGSYVECLRASNYLDEIGDYKDSLKLKEVILEKAINFKKTTSEVLKWHSI